jgi:23S rRNA (uracil1939-C5)-methyltransferase
VTTPPASASRPSRGDELELTIDTLAHGGNGVARLDGYVVFVAGAVPGDRVRAVVGKAKRAYAEARALEVIEPAPDRVPPRADHPGAPWQVIPYERQLEIKTSQVDDALRRIGRLDGFALEPMVPAVEQWRYRNKMEYSFGAGPDGELVCGFHAPGRFDEIVPVDDVLLASERSNDARRRVLAWAREQGLEPWDRRAHRGFLRNLVVREGRRTGQLQVRLVTSPGRLDTDSLTAAVDCDGVFWTQTPDLGESTLGGETTLLAGAPQLRERLGELEFLISPDAFFQTNTEMAERLYGTAVELAALRGHERVFDLYSGIGTIALSMAARAREVVGVEIVEAAVADAIDNARRNEVTNATFYAGDIRLAMRELVERAGRPDVCVIDPPRAGLSQKVVRRIVEAGPRRIVYVSCNPTTLAPNAAQLVEAGWSLTRVRPVDMFPQTPHIECVALLERAG